MLKVVHFSITPLAGAPVRLVQTLNRLTDIKARLVDIRRNGLYDHDIVFEESPEEAQHVCNEADIIHLHNYLDLDSIQFSPIDFKKLLKSGKRVLRHFHSTSDWIAEQMGISEEKLLGCSLPSLVIAQYPERFFTKSRIVPNLIPHSEPLYQPLTESESNAFDIFFSPTKKVGAFERRWDTKGAPETSAIIERVARSTGCTFKIMTDRPLAEALEAKRRSRIVVDDLVTGSYHLTGLEGLAQGKAVLAYLDSRSLKLLRYISGSDHCPFINVRLEDAGEVLEWLLEHPEEHSEIGRAGREWIIKNWNEKRLISHFVNVYKDIITDSESLNRQQELTNDSVLDIFFNKTLHDLIYDSRRKQNILMFGE